MDVINDSPKRTARISSRQRPDRPVSRRDEVHSGATEARPLGSLNGPVFGRLGSWGFASRGDGAR
jgi:hypothetical protein